MCECLEVCLSLCSCSTELKVNEDLLKREVENMKHEYEDMMLGVRMLLFLCLLNDSMFTGICMCDLSCKNLT